MLAVTGQTDEAEQMTRQLEAEEPGCLECYRLLSAIYGRQERHDKVRAMGGLLVREGNITPLILLGLNGLLNGVWNGTQVICTSPVQSVHTPHPTPPVTCVHRILCPGLRPAEDSHTFTHKLVP